MPRLMHAMNRVTLHPLTRLGSPGAVADRCPRNKLRTSNGCSATLAKGNTVSEDRHVLLCSYGTLQLERVQLESFGRRLDGADDAMPGYRRTMLEITDPDVIRTSGERFHPIVSQ